MTCRIFCVFCFIFFALHSAVFAGPANPAPFTIRQPDGNQFQARLKGDERVNWIETIERYPIARNNVTGFWEYAELQPDIGLAPSGKVVGKDLPEGISKISAGDISASTPARALGPMSAPSAAPPLPQPAPLNILGTRKLLVILVNFTDRTLTTTESDWDSKVFNDTSNSVKKYYTEVSYGQLTFAPATESYGTVNNGIVVVTLSSAHPDTGAVYGTSNQQLAKDAIVAADPFVDFSSYDTNSDGKITNDELNIMVVAAGYEESYSISSSPSIWAHKWCIQAITPPTADGKIVGGNPGGYTQLGELHNDHSATIGTLIHELGHDLGTATIYFGLPDLYDADNSSHGVGYWCSMSAGLWNYATVSGDKPAHFNAWCKWYLGWLTPSQITSTQTGVSFPRVEDETVADHGVKQVLDNPNGPEISGTGEYFLIENRQLSGYDAGLPGAGILIWHIDETQADNATESQKLVDLEEADGLNHLDLKTNAGDDGDPYPGTTVNRTFNDTSSPNSKLYSGANSDVGVENISNSLVTMTADIIIADRPPVLASPGDKTVNENQLLTFTLSATDPDNDTISYSITNGPSGVTLDSSTGVFSWIPAYTQSGAYPVTFTATSTTLSNSKAITITVNNVDRPPALTPPGDKDVNETQLLTFTLSAADPDGDVITYSMASTPTGVALNAVTGVFSWTPAYTQSGAYNVTFTITANGQSDSEAITINVINIDQPPVLTSPGNKSIYETQTLTFALSASDPDGNAITYSATGLPPGAGLNSTTGIFDWTPTYTQSGAYPVTFTATANSLSNSKAITITVTNLDRLPVLAAPGDKAVTETQLLTFTISASDPDGDTISYSMTGGPSGATLDSVTGVFDWTPTYAQSGAYPVTFIANGLSNPATITITVNNVDRPPVLAAPGDKAVDENQLLAFTISASDPDAETINYSMTGGPSGATLNSTTRVFDWTPTYAQSGVYNVTFAATANGQSDSKAITITVNNINGPPVLAAPGDKTVIETQLLAFTLSASDPDGDTITYSATGLPPGASLNSTNGNFNWTPDYTQSGSYANIKFRATVAGGLFSEKTITITVTDISSPSQAVSPTPADSATDVPITITQLSWASATDATSYNVYFGISSTPVFAINLNTTYYLLPALSYNTTYYWRIDSKNSVGITAGATWSFTTQPSTTTGSSGQDTTTGSSGGSHKKGAKCGLMGIEVLALLGLLLIIKRRQRHQLP